MILCCRCGDTPALTASATPSILGKWAQNHTHDDKTYHDFIGFFKADGTYDASEDGKIVVTGGTYEVKSDTLYLNDPVCNPHNPGIYKLIFYAQDSLRFELISDSCNDRRNGTIHLKCKKVPNQ